MFFWAPVIKIYADLFQSAIYLDSIMNEDEIKKLPPKEPESKHKDFIKANWKYIAINGYRFFEAKGRGIITVQEEEFLFPEHDGPVDLHYQTELKEFFEYLGDFDVSEEETLVKEYDPETQVILTIIRNDDSRPVSYLLTGNPTPFEINESQIPADNLLTSLLSENANSPLMTKKEAKILAKLLGGSIGYQCDGGHSVDFQREDGKHISIRDWVIYEYTGDTDDVGGQPDKYIKLKSPL